MAGRAVLGAIAVAAVVAISQWAAGAALAQSAPAGSEIWLVEIEFRAGTRIVAGTPERLTERFGYDNQPAFTADGRSLLYVSYRDGQADVYRCDLFPRHADGTRPCHQLTETSTSEYSPQPAADGDGFTVVRVEADSTQRIWRFPEQGEPKPLLEDLSGVGYYAWGDSVTVVAFVIADPPELAVADVPSGRWTSFWKNVGRTMAPMPEMPSVSFLHREENGDWWVKGLDLTSGAVHPLVVALPESRDYAWTPDGVLLMAQGSKLYQWFAGRNRAWQEVADFSEAGLSGITRLAVSPRGDWLALVAEER